jgi:beta-phosphoglucomutase-like phosphatase (HAD superfamily)
MTRFDLVILDCDGVHDGIAAGMIVFGYAELMNEDALRNAGAHNIFTTMESLLTAINQFE